jgi:hypothetical protein
MTKNKIVHVLDKVLFVKFKANRYKHPEQSKPTSSIFWFSASWSLVGSGHSSVGLPLASKQFIFVFKNYFWKNLNFLFLINFFNIFWYDYVKNKKYLKKSSLQFREADSPKKITEAYVLPKNIYIKTLKIDFIKFSYKFFMFYGAWFVRSLFSCAMLNNTFISIYLFRKKIKIKKYTSRFQSIMLSKLAFIKNTKSYRLITMAEDIYYRELKQ